MAWRKIDYINGQGNAAGSGNGR